MVDIDLRETALRRDDRLNGNARQIARVLARRFHEGNGRCQLSFERLAGEAGIISFTNVREALGMMKRTGWIESERVPGATHRGLEYRPVMTGVEQRSSQIESDETALEVFQRITAGSPRFREVKPSDKAFAILGARVLTKPK